MYRSSLRRMIGALALGAVLLSPWAVSAEPRFTNQTGQLSRVAALPLDLVTRLWHFVNRVLTKNGAWIDPNGGSNPTAQGDTGCSLDPHGGCGQ